MKEMASVPSSGKMAPSIRVNGKMEKGMEKEGAMKKVKVFIKETGTKVSLMEKEYSLAKTVKSTKETSRMI